jgi:excinuclease ABC subunit B
VERINGPVFAVEGGQDQVWPSSIYVENIARRMREHGRNDVTALTYADAGHGVGLAAPNIRVATKGSVRGIYLDLGGTQCHVGEVARVPQSLLARGLRLAPMRKFETSSDYRPTGDQPTAIEELSRSILAGERYQTLLGATGTGKTATMAWIVEQVQKPTLVIAHNKTLAAQLCNEFREFFPTNAVEYFVSYYDYYQPEAYVPQADLYIEKDSSQNDDIARLRLNATSSLFTRRDVIVVASVSCIYGLGSPEEWRDRMIYLELNEEHDRDLFLRKLIDSQYVRNDTVLGRGRFRVKGDVVEIQPANQETAYRVSFFGDEVEQITHFDPLSGEVYAKLDNLAIWPATEYVTSQPTIERAVDEIRHELEQRLRELESENKMLEAHRLRQRTEYDLEMLKELGFCNGIENYSRILEGRAPGTHPFTLLDYFPNDFLVFVDESHQTVPQVGGMYEGDRSRKQTLVDYGFRLPSALDNRPLRFDEFLRKVPQLAFVSATPGPFELRHSTVISEQLIRPTFLIDPEVELRETRNQIDDLLNEIRRREEVGERVLVTTLTKKMAEDLTDYLLESGVKARYLHSEIDTLERIQIIRELRLGEYDVLVGVNLLREGLDLPEVSLVAILDADKEGFLRGKTALIQTIGRAARNLNGKVIMYADKLTEAIKGALDETNRRRAKQIAYNEEHGITPESIVKGVSDIAEFLMLEQPHVPSKRRRGAAKVEGMSREELEKLVIELEEEMFAAAEELRFEYAAKLRDEIKELRRELVALAAV